MSTVEIAGKKYEKFEHRGRTYLLLGKAKRPIMDAGFGLFGMMLSGLDGSTILCHECGRLVSIIGGQHLKAAHKMNAREYRDKYSLRSGERLASLQFREKSRQHEQCRVLEGKHPFTNKDGIQMRGPLQAGTKERSERQRKYHQTIAYQNAVDTCELQLLRRFLNIAAAHGIPPNAMVSTLSLPFGHLVKGRFGSWSAGKAALLALREELIDKGETWVR